MLREMKSYSKFAMLIIADLQTLYLIVVLYCTMHLFFPILSYLLTQMDIYTVFRKKVIYLFLPHISHSFCTNFTKLSVNIHK